MTGGRPGRDPRIAGRRERGPRRGEQTPGEARWTGTGGAELEELHAGVVAARGGARIGVRSAFAGVALVGLLAVGLGAFGGRPQPSTAPVGSPVAVATSSQPPVAPPGTPGVTPFVRCAPETNAVPSVLLEVGGEVHPGSIEVLYVNPGGLPLDAPKTAPIETVKVDPEDGTAIVIEDDRCALGWVLDLDTGVTIDAVANGALDPASSAQNRFELGLAQDPGRNAVLRAQLQFPGFVMRASWRVRVVFPEHPRAELQWLDGEVQPALEGCFVAFEYETGWQEPFHECHGEDSPGDAKSVHERAEFRFSFGDWPLLLNGISCGHGMDDAYMPDDDACAWTRNEADGVITVELAPTLAKGPWTLAVDACAYNGPIYGAELCGTWYAPVRLR